MKAVHFGAGNIGRGFIGLLLARSGYELCFVARNKNQVKLFQQRGRYTVMLANPARDTMVVDGVSAAHTDDVEAVEERVAAADVVTTAVGASALPDIAGAIAGGIGRMLNRGGRPLHVMACENAIGGSARLKELVYGHLPEELHEAADRFVAFPNTIVDRIVPLQRQTDPLAVKVEPFYEWIIQRTEIKAGFPGIEGVQYADSLEPYMERKLFTVNTGHCSAAYFGYIAGHRTIQEAMRDEWVRARVEGVLAETSQLLIRKHGFDERKHRDYVRKTLERFENPALTDKVIRVGRAPLRKLAANERLARPAMQASAAGIPVPELTAAMGAALLFDYEPDLEAVILQIAIRQKGAGHVLRRHTGIKDHHPLHAQILAAYRRMMAQRADSGKRPLSM